MKDSFKCQECGEIVFSQQPHDITNCQSFKAGDAFGYDRGFIKGQSDGLKTGREQGRKEVVVKLKEVATKTRA